MPLPALDLLSAIIAARGSTHSRGLDGLRVDNPGTGLRLPTGANADETAQRIVQAPPEPFQTPQTKVMVNRFPARQVMREQVPRASAAQPVEDPVQNFALTIQPGPPARFRRWQELCQLCPLGIGEIGLIGLSFHCCTIADQR